MTTQPLSLSEVSALGLARAGLTPELPGVEPYEAYQRLEARLDLFSESTILTRYDTEGRPVTVYEVAPSAVAQALTGICVNSGLLPERCLGYALRDGVVSLAVYQPPACYTVEVQQQETHSLTIPLPGLVFMGTGTHYYVFAVQEPPTQPQTMLYLAPCPNVHPRGGTICTGNAPFPPCSTLTIWAAFQAFITSAFNGDYTGGKSRHHKNILDLWRQLDAQHATDYPLADLVTSGLHLEQFLAGRNANSAT